MTRLHFRFPAAAALLAAVLAIGTTSAAVATTTAGHLARGNRAPANTCEHTRYGASELKGVVQNETNEPLHVIKAERGITNSWCIPPTNVPAHGSITFWVFDGVFLSHVHLIYDSPSGGRAGFFATLGFGDHVDIGCSAESSRGRGCEAVVTKRGHSRHARFSVEVRFRVFSRS